MNKLGKLFIIIICIILVAFGVTKFFYNYADNTNENIISEEVLENKVTNDTLKTNNEIKENDKIEEDTQIENKVYSILDKEFYLYDNPDERYKEYRGIKLLEYDNSNEKYAEIYYILYDYGTEPGLEYTIEITDINKKSILIDGKKNEKIIGGLVSNIKIKKINFDEEIYISVYEKYSEEKEYLNEATVKINLGKDLQEKVIFDQSDNVKDGKLGDIKYQYVDSENIHIDKTAHAYSKKLVGESLSITVDLQYGNRLISGEHLEFSYDKNVNNLKLNDAFEKLNLITTVVGQYGLSDFYGMNLKTEGDKLGEVVVITFEDMINLCNGLTIEKDGIKYTKDSFEIYEGMSMIKDGDIEIGNGIKAIKYHFESDEDVERYMFVYKENIYEIRLPVNERISKEMLKFLDNLEMIK